MPSRKLWTVASRMTLTKPNRTLHDTPQTSSRLSSWSCSLPHWQMLQVTSSNLHADWAPGCGAGSGLIQEPRCPSARHSTVSHAKRTVLTLQIFTWRQQQVTSKLLWSTFSNVNRAASLMPVNSLRWFLIKVLRLTPSTLPVAAPNLIVPSNKTRRATIYTNCSAALYCRRNKRRQCYLHISEINLGAFHLLQGKEKHCLSWISITLLAPVSICSSFSISCVNTWLLSAFFYGLCLLRSVCFALTWSHCIIFLTENDLPTYFTTWCQITLQLCAPELNGWPAEPVWPGTLEEA